MHSKTTPTLGLPIIEPKDHPDWLTDWNEAMKTLDGYAESREFITEPLFENVVKTQAELVEDVKSIKAKDIDQDTRMDGLQSSMDELEHKLNHEHDRNDIQDGQITNLKSDLTTETMRAETAEANLQTNINAEANRALAAESMLQDNINAEVTRATAEETEINENINVITNLVAKNTGDIKTANENIALNTAGVRTEHETNDAQNARLTALEDAGNTTNEDITNLKAQVKTNHDDIQQLQLDSQKYADMEDVVVVEQSVTGLTSRVTAVEEKAEQNHQDILALQAGGGGGDPSESIESLDTRLTSAEGKITDLQTTTTNTENSVNALAGRVTTAEQNITTLTGTTETLEADISTEETTRASEITRVEGLITAEENARTSEITRVEGLIQTEATKRAQDDTTINGRIDAIETTESNRVLSAAHFYPLAKRHVGTNQYNYSYNIELYGYKNNSDVGFIFMPTSTSPSGATGLSSWYDIIKSLYSNRDIIGTGYVVVESEALNTFMTENHCITSVVVTEGISMSNEVYIPIFSATSYKPIGFLKLIVQSDGTKYIFGVATTSITSPINVSIPDVTESWVALATNTFIISSTWRGRNI